MLLIKPIDKGSPIVGLRVQDGGDNLREGTIFYPSSVGMDFSYQWSGGGDFINQVMEAGSYFA